VSAQEEGQDATPRQRHLRGLLKRDPGRFFAMLTRFEVAHLAAGPRRPARHAPRPTAQAAGPPPEGEEGGLDLDDYLQALMQKEERLEYERLRSKFTVGEAAQAGPVPAPGGGADEAALGPVPHAPGGVVELTQRRD
jgi:hypothetical protein